jgi:hypothetical protein
MMKIDVAPVSAMASFVAIVTAFKYCCVGLPNNIRAVAASDGGLPYYLFDVTTVLSSSLSIVNALIFWVGYGT